MGAIAATRTELGEQFSEGARLLWKQIEMNGLSQGALARLLGAKPGVLPRWLYGDTKPSWDWAVKIRDVLSIPLEAWTLAPTISFVPPAARDADESGEHLAVTTPTKTSAS